MSDKTIFSIITPSIEEKLYSVGFDYMDKTYINAFRWLWNEKHIHPEISSFIGDPENKARVCLRSLKSTMTEYDTYYCTGYDDAIIWVVEQIARNLDKFFTINKNEQYY